MSPFPLKVIQAMELSYNLYTPMLGVPKGSAPIILLHSIIENKKTWNFIGPALANNTQRRVYSLDLRNHGSSPRTDEYNIDVMSEDLEEFLVNHRISKAVLVGHSLGGKVAIAFTLKKPTKVEKLIVEDVGVTKIKMGDGTMVSQVMSNARSIYESMATGSNEKVAMEQLKSLVKLFIPFFSMSEDFADVYPVELYPVKWNGKSLEVEINLDGVTNAIIHGSLQPKDFEGKYEGDVLLIIGEKSQFRVHKDKNVAKHFPRASKVILDSGHFVHQSCPDEYIRIVTEFINQGRLQRSKY